jgi:FKBP-type peptidyl-prolyl cis-trans isomerase
MATRKSQRIGIWVIAATMLIGTLGAYFAVFLDNNNQADQLAEQQKLQQQIQEQMAKCPTGPVSDEKVEPAPTPPEAPVIENVTELKTVDLTTGDGAEVKDGDCVDIFFHGTLASSGKAFQGGDNYAEGIPYRSATGGFVPGFAKGLVGMKVGGERQIIIPSDLGYGAQGQGEIPANADLVFTVKLVNIYKQ